jgi:hypothetical protein
MAQPESTHDEPRDPESGKVGLAILMWLLGVPGLLILLYLIFF